MRSLLCLLALSFCVGVAWRLAGGALPPSGDEPAKKPDLTFLYSISNVGYIEPCG